MNSPSVVETLQSLEGGWGVVRLPISSGTVADRADADKGRPGSVDEVIAVESDRYTWFLAICYRTPFEDLVVLVAVLGIS